MLLEKHKTSSSRNHKHEVHILGLLVIILAIVSEVYATPIIRTRDSVSYVGYKLYRAEVFPAQMPIVDSLDGTDGIAVWNWLFKSENNSYEMDVLSSPEKDRQVKELFDDVSVQYNVVIDDLQEAIEIENANESPLLENRYGHPMTWETYHSTKDMVQYMHYLEQTYPDSVEVLEIGKTYENRTLYVVKVSTGDEEIQRPAVWIDGGMHAREWVSPAVVSYFLQRLVEIPDESSDIVKSFDWYIMPMANPDGYEYSRTHDRLWRKNRSGNSGDPCKGVDLNRNFGHKWNEGHSLRNKCSDEFRGTEPFSEPETQAISQFLTSIRNELKVYVSIHAYKQLWMYPWAYTRQTLHDTLNPAAAKVATEALNKLDRSEQYKHGRAADLLYSASGTAMDYAYGKLGVPYSFSLELRDRGEHGFLLPKDQITPTAEETSKGLFAMAQEVLRHL